MLLAQLHDVCILDVVPDKVEKIQRGSSPLADPDIERFLAEAKAGARTLTYRATLDAGEAYADAEYVIVATPTNYDPSLNSFDTSSVESAIRAVRSVNATAWIVVKSTVPVGYTDRTREAFRDDRIIFSPEFLREGRALYDNLNPSRIVVGAPAGDEPARRAAARFADLLAEAAGCEKARCEGADPEERDPEERSPEEPGSGRRDIPRLVCGCAEAESIKLFSNTFLALRVSFFNELDTYAEARGLDAAQVIEGVCADPRIGDFYNNPSFGYGGYCLPKDTKQLLANYSDVPQNLIGAIVEANQTRKDHVAGEVLARLEAAGGSVVGVYRLVMKKGSDNFRDSSVFGVVQRLREAGARVVVYEPMLGPGQGEGLEVVDDFSRFADLSDVVIANRWSDELAPIEEKVYTRDIFRRD